VLVIELLDGDISRRSAAALTTRVLAPSQGSAITFWQALRRAISKPAPDPVTTPADDQDDQEFNEIH